jgi:hypothetical protein
VKIEKLSEYGYEEAALGFSLSYNATIDRAKEIMPRYAFGVPGENKFLESMYIWWDITAPRFWWQEADTYRLSTKQSESTMHTLSKKPFSNDMFEYALDHIELDNINVRLTLYREKWITLDQFKSYLPEGFLQRRIWCMNYKCLQNVYNQRKNHKLPQWQKFCQEVLDLIIYPEFIKKDYE